jgi:uncharacterized membrane protein
MQKTLTFLSLAASLLAMINTAAFYYFLFTWNPARAGLAYLLAFLAACVLAIVSKSFRQKVRRLFP